MSTFDKGKWAEAEVEKWLTARSNAEAGFAWHRYPDSRSARGALAAQPADYVIGHLPLNGNRYAMHLEVKETAELRRLPKAKIGQYGKLKLFTLAGFRARVLVYRSAHKDWVYFDEPALFDYPECPASFPFAGRRSFPSHTEALKEIFG